MEAWCTCELANEDNGGIDQVCGVHSVLDNLPSDALEDLRVIREAIGILEMAHEHDIQNTRGNTTFFSEPLAALKERFGDNK